MRATSNNPALNRIPQFAAANRTGYPTGYGADPIAQAYYGPTATSAQTGRMTVEDVVMRTGILLAVLIATGAATWVLGLEALALPAAIIGLVLGLVISFKSITNPAVIVTYAAMEGVFLGGISKLFDERSGGIVLQALVGTVSVAGVMLALYSSGKIRVTPQFQKMVVGATLGFLVLLVANLVVGFFVPGGLGLRGGGLLGIAISVFAIGLAALNLVLDFDLVQKAAQQGLPERYGWLSAFGLVVTLVWLYVEILRLLSILRGSD